MISSWSSSEDFWGCPLESSFENFSGLSMTSDMSLLRSSACCSSLVRSSSTSMTASRALRVSLGSTSSLRKKMSIELGTGRARAPSALRRVDFPHPLRPINPYRLPWLSTTEVSSSRTAPMCSSVTLVTLMSRARASTPLREVAKVQMVPAAARASDASWSIPSSPVMPALPEPSPPLPSPPRALSFSARSSSGFSEASAAPFLPLFLAAFLASRFFLARAFFSSLLSFFSKSSSSPPPMAAPFVRVETSNSSSSRVWRAFSKANSACRCFFWCHFDDMVDCALVDGS
mmetsp:Transcript_28599/g.77442  ORF Transcript_28599/g.77442 Transcript_28599/m.77442 type:complete len:288 (+) Transcript_28599:2146-3009(+)